MWRSENNSRGQFSPSTVGSGHRTQLIGLCGKSFYPMAILLAHVFLRQSLAELPRLSSNLCSSCPHPHPSAEIAGVCGHTWLPSSGFCFGLFLFCFGLFPTSLGPGFLSFDSTLIPPNSKEVLCPAKALVPSVPGLTGSLGSLLCSVSSEKILQQPKHAGS